MAKDLYSILGVSKSASQDDVKKAYRAMSKEWHPDKHKGDKGAEQKFKEINEAYETLSDPQKRQMYDQFGSTGGPSGPNGGGGNPFGGFNFNGAQGANFDFGDLFGSFFGGNAQPSPRERTRGEDRQIEVAVDLLETVTNVHRKVKVTKLVPCQTCSGKGAEAGSELVKCEECSGTGQVTRTAQSFFGAIRQVQVCSKCAGSGKIPQKPCRSCDGEGRRREQVELTIDVPAGIADGQTLRINGQGEAGLRGGEPGDLYVVVHVRSDARFERDGADVRTTVHIPVVDAILGQSIEIDTVHGKTTIQIPEGTQPGQTLRIKGKGLPVLGASRMGDHYILVEVEIPKKLSREERRLMEEWRKAQG